MRLRRAISILALVPAVAALVACGDATSADQRAMAGRWRIVTAQGFEFQAEIAGEPQRVAIGQCPMRTIDIRGDTLTWRIQPPLAVGRAWVPDTSGQVLFDNRRGMLVQTDRICVNGNPQPKVIDLTVMGEGEPTPFKFKGIYEIRGDTMRIALSGYLDTRPTDFASARVLTLKRE